MLSVSVGEQWEIIGTLTISGTDPVQNLTLDVETYNFRSLGDLTVEIYSGNTLVYETDEPISILGSVEFGSINPGVYSTVLSGTAIDNGGGTIVLRMRGSASGSGVIYKPFVVLDVTVPDDTNSNDFPLVSITSPADGSYHSIADAVEFEGSVVGVLNPDFLWSFGDGATPSTSTQESPSFTFSSAGAFTVTLEATNPANGFSDEASVSLTIDPLPVANIAAPTAGEQNFGPVAFSSAGSNGFGLTYLWSFGDSTTSTLASPSHTYSGAGPYTVQLTVTDRNGKTSTDSVVVSIEQIVPLSLTFSLPDVLQIASVNQDLLLGNGVIVGFSYAGDVSSLELDLFAYSASWYEFDTATTTIVWPQEEIPTANPYFPRIYVGPNYLESVCKIDISYTLDGVGGPLSGVKTVIVERISAPQIAITGYSSGLASIAILTEPETMYDFDIYDYRTLENYQYSINNGEWVDISPVDVDSPVQVPASPGQSIRLRGKIGAAVGTASNSVSVPSGAFNANIATPSDGSSFEINDPISFSASLVNGFGPFTYLWNFGDGSTSTSASPAYSYSSVDTYTVTLTVTDSQNNQSSNNINLTISSEPTIPTVTAPVISLASSDGSTAVVSLDTPSTVVGQEGVPISGVDISNYQYRVNGGTWTSLSPSDTISPISIPATYTDTIEVRGVGPGPSYSDPSNSISVPVGDGTLFTHFNAGNTAILEAFGIGDAPFVYNWQSSNGDAAIFNPLRKIVWVGMNAQDSGSYDISVDVQDNNSNTVTLTTSISGSGFPPPTSDISVYASWTDINGSETGFHPSYDGVVSGATYFIDVTSSGSSPIVATYVQLSTYLMDSNMNIIPEPEVIDEVFLNSPNLFLPYAFIDEPTPPDFNRFYFLSVSAVDATGATANSFTDENQITFI